MRGEIRARLAPLSVAESASLGVRVAEQVSALPEYRDAQLIVLYAASPEELPTRELLAGAQDTGCRCALPRVLPEKRLEFAIAPRWENLRLGRYGLLEPGEGSAVVALGDADLVLVPGLAFDVQGGRLGRGGGYYDRALADVVASVGRPPIFGLAHDWQVVDAVPGDERDVRVDGVLTERRCVRVVSR
jgi:5-formyltetrahydrofolate cyclo-ligase